MGMKRTALLVGATGLVGESLLRLLLADDEYEKVVVLARRRLMLDHPKLEQHHVDFDNLGPFVSLMRAKDVFCCLGTTIKKAGSQEEFRKVDYGYPLRVAEIAVSQDATQFLIVTSIGADPRSRIFYNRVKGDVEWAVIELSFTTTHIFRPSILLGDRRESRQGEKLGIVVMKMLSLFMIGPWRKYHPIKAVTVAEAMVAAAKSYRVGVNIYESDAIQRMVGLNS